MLISKIQIQIPFQKILGEMGETPEGIFYDLSNPFPSIEIIVEGNPNRILQPGRTACIKVKSQSPTSEKEFPL